MDTESALTRNLHCVDAVQQYFSEAATADYTLDERELRLALEDDQVPIDVRAVLRREIKQRYPPPSRYVDTEQPMFAVGKLPSTQWTYVGCVRFKKPVSEARTIAERNWSSLPQVLDQTIAQHREQVGLVRWSSHDTIMVVPDQPGQRLLAPNQEFTLLPNSACTVSTYTDSDDKSNPAIELYTRRLSGTATSQDDNQPPETQPIGDDAQNITLMQRVHRLGWKRIALIVLLLMLAVLVLWSITRRSWRPPPPPIPLREWW